MKIISIDTDGLYIDSKIDINKLNEYLDKKTDELFKLKNYLHVESDTFSAGYFRKTRGKHYILKDKDKLLIHGQSFKGSHQPKFFDDVLVQLANDLFDGKIGRTIDIKSFTIESLIQNIKVKDESSYKNDSSLSMQLINAVKKEMPNIHLKDDDQLSFLRTDNGYELIMPGKTYGEIDWKYYQSILDKIYERLAMEDKAQVRFI